MKLIKRGNMAIRVTRSNDDMGSGNCSLHRVMFLALFVLTLVNVPMQGQEFWQSLGGPYAKWLSGFHVTGSGNLIAYGQGIFRSTNDGDSWTKISGRYVVSFASGNGGLYFCGSKYEDPVRSTDAGITWESFSVQGTRLMYFTVGPTGVAFGSDGKNAIFRSIDRGENWELVRDSVAVSAFAHMKDGAILAGGTILLLSSDNGTSWNDRGYALPETPVQEITTLQDGTIFIFSYHGVYSSLDVGNTWAKLSGRAIGVASDGNGKVVVVYEDSVIV